MKKVILLLIVLVFTLSGTACEININDIVKDVIDDVNNAIDDAANEIIDGLGDPDSDLNNEDDITEEVSDENFDIEEITGGTVFETEFWSITVPDGWILNEDKTYESSSTQNRTFEKLDAEGNAELTVRVNASIVENAYDFRKTLVNNEFSLKDYSEGKLEGIVIEDVNFVKIKSSYNGRYEKQQLNVYFSFDHIKGTFGDDFAAALPTFLSIAKTFQVKAEDVGNVDAPYPWDGENYSPVVGSAEIGAFKFEPVWMVPDTRFLPMNTSNIKLGVFNKIIYIMGDKTLKSYMIGDNEINLISDMDLPGSSHNSMQVDVDGNVYISDVSSGLMVYFANEMVAQYNNIKKFETYVHPSGKWGLGYFMSPKPEDVIKFTFNGDGTAEVVQFEFENYTEMSNIHGLVINDEHILVHTSNKVIYVYDFEGNLLKTLETKTFEPLNTAEAIVEIENGYFAYDDVINYFYAWYSDGTYLGRAKNAELFGTSSANIESIVMAADGSFYLAATDRRPDGSWDEVLVFKLIVS